jgi:glycosyltransferase involved in cell wall biosynthesis
MRIGIDGRYIQDHFPGIGRYTYSLIEALARVAGDESFIVLHNPALRNTRYDVAALARYDNVTLVPVDVPTFALAEQTRLPWLVWKLRLDVLHSPYYIKPYLLSCPSVVSLYDLIAARYPQYLPSPWARLAFAITTRLAITTARLLITLSAASRRDLAELYGVPPERVAVTPLAADEHFQPIAEATTLDAVRRKYCLPEHFVLYLGSNKPHKNLVRLVEAWALILSPQSSGPNRQSAIGAAHGPPPRGNPQLVIAGHWDPRYPQAQQKATESGLEENVRFLGDVSEADLPALYNLAAIFAFPSLYEGFGLPPLEAMACGTPVVCANTSSLPEVVGDAALLFDPLDVQAMAATIAQALSYADLRAALRARGLARARLFSWGQVARETLAAYRETAGSN